MEKEFVPYEESLKMKELDFDEPCLGLFDDKKLDYDGEIRVFPFNNSLTKEGAVDKFIVAAPLWQQAFRWFREKHNLLVSPFQDFDDVNNIVHSYYFEIGRVGNLTTDTQTDSFKTYEEAQLSCLRELIKIIKDETIKNMVV